MQKWSKETFDSDLKLKKYGLSLLEYYLETFPNHKKMYGNILENKMVQGGYL